MLVYELMQDASQQLHAAGIKEAVEVDVQLLLSHCLKKTRSELLLARSETVATKDQKKFNSLLERRIKREPVAYILGHQEFWSLDFEVNSAVLIPRPETEFLLEQVLKIQNNNAEQSNKKILDLCTGSGAIAVVLAKELNEDIVAVDLSPDALKIAMKNCQHNGVEHLVELIESDLFSVFERNVQFDLVVSNPPYIQSTDIQYSLEPEVSLFEPKIALDGGGDGLDIIRLIRKDLPYHLFENGMFFMEFGAEQGNDIQELFQRQGADGSCFDDVEIIKDYAGRDRVLCARFAGFTRG